MEATKPLAYKSFTDNETGEIIELPVIYKNLHGNKDFEMIFYGHFLEILNDLGNKKIQVLRYIIQKRDKLSNVVIATVRDIAKELNMSLKTVNDTLVLLEDKGAIKRKTGVIFIDADLVCDGRFKGRIMHVYNNVDDKLTVEEQKTKVEREIKRKEEELKELEKIKDKIFLQHTENQSYILQ
jgi:predicted transcriptional regulator